MNTPADLNTITALRTILAANGGKTNARFNFSAIPYDVAVSLIAERLVDTDGSVNGWEITPAGVALLAAAPPAPRKFGLVTVNGQARLVPCEEDGTIRVNQEALRREFGIPAGAPIVIN